MMTKLVQNLKKNKFYSKLRKKKKTFPFSSLDCVDVLFCSIRARVWGWVATCVHRVID